MSRTCAITPLCLSFFVAPFAQAQDAAARVASCATMLSALQKYQMNFLSWSSVKMMTEWGMYVCPGPRGEKGYAALEIHWRRAQLGEPPRR